MDDEEVLDEEEENALVQYCFSDLYGPNFGFRTRVDFEEQCEVGVDCESNLEEDENDDEEQSFAEEKGEYQLS